MLFVAICTDKPGLLQTRLDNRPAHLAFIEEHRTMFRVAGPFLGPDDKPNGSLLILECASESDARALLSKDPYARAGLFASVDLRPWRQAVGQPVA
jgi:uncharacterized protein YciI